MNASSNFACWGVIQNLDLDQRKSVPRLVKLEVVGENTGRRMDMPGVLDALYKGHVNVAALSRVLERQFMAFDGAEPMDYAIIGDILAYCRDFPGIRHHPIEDHLYIVVRGLNPELAMETAPIVAEHEALSGLVVEVSVMLNQVLMEIPVPGSPTKSTPLGIRAAIRQ
jgi:hypothetical protein|tara:strand:- start:23 stop:526 length:504 start_codon:yes stop_codon:yes gene_type:complete